MAKYSIKNKKNQLFINVKLGRDEVINNRDISVFNTKIIRGVLRPNIKAANKINFIAPKGISLLCFLKRGISSNDFFIVLVQLADVIKKLERNKLNLNNLSMQLNTVFVNEKTKEVNFIYLPIVGDVCKNNLFDFLNEIIDATEFNSKEDINYLNKISQFLKEKKYFDASEIENYISCIYPQVFNQIKIDKTGHSQMLYSKKLNYYRSKEESELMNEDTSLLDEYQDETTLIDENYEDTSLLEDYDEGTALLEDYEDEGTSLLDEYEEGTSLLVEEEDTSLLQAEEGTSLLEEIEDEGTALLDDEQELGGTTLLEQDLPNYPFLIRLSTYDRIDVTKSVFKIGKEKSFVDCYIANNNAVSRVHADIITANNKYFVRDNNSTNRTFVNGTEIPVNQEIEIVEGDIIMLANEAFAFHID